MFFKGGHEEVGKGGCTLCAHGHFLDLSVAPVVEGEDIVLDGDKQEVPQQRFLRQVIRMGSGWSRRVSSVQDHGDAEVLGDVGVQGLYVHCSQKDVWREKRFLLQESN